MAEPAVLEADWEKVDLEALDQELAHYPRPTVHRQRLIGNSRC